MSTDRNPLSDKELWQRIAAPAVAPVADSDVKVSDMDLAAWLDGRLPESEAARIEAALGVDPVLRRGALDLADILGKPVPAPSPRLAVRAQALVGFEAERVSLRGGFFSRLFTSGAVFGVPRAAMATLALGVAVAGFLLGGGLGESYAQQKYVVASNQTTTTGYTGSYTGSISRSNELTAFFGSDGI